MLYHFKLLRTGEFFLYYFDEEVEKIEFNDFIEHQEITPLLQSYQWANVKQNFKPYHVGARKNGELFATALILIRKVTLGFQFAYIPRGPVYKSFEFDDVEFFINSIKEFVKKKGCFMLSLDPEIFHKRYMFADQETALPFQRGQMTLETYQKLGFIHNGYTFDFTDSFQPRLEAFIDLKPDVKKRYHRRLNQALRYTKRRQTFVEVGNDEDFVDRFIRLAEKTEERQNVSFRQKEYYQLLLDSYPGKCFISIATINPAASLKTFQEEIKNRQIEIEKVKDKSPKKSFHLQEQIDSYQSLIEEIEPLSGQTSIDIGGMLWVVYGNTMSLLYAGTDVEFTKYYPQHLIYDSLVSKALELQLKFVNLGGVIGNLDDGLTMFKLQFSPFIHEYIGELTYPITPVYHLYRLAWWLRSRYLRFKQR